MTTADLHRALAGEIDRREELERQVAELQKQLEQTRSAMLAVAPAEWLPVADAARYICKSASWLHKDRLQYPPRIPYRQECAGGLVFYKRTDLDAYNESRMRGRKKAA